MPVTSGTRFTGKFRSVHDAREERQLVLQEMQSLEARLANAPLPAGVPDGLTEDAVVNATSAKAHIWRGLADFGSSRSVRKRCASLMSGHERDGPPPDGSVPEDIDPSDVKAALR